MKVKEYLTENKKYREGEYKLEDYKPKGKIVVGFVDKYGEYIYDGDWVLYGPTKKKDLARVVWSEGPGGPPKYCLRFKKNDIALSRDPYKPDKYYDRCAGGITRERIIKIDKNRAKKILQKNKYENILEGKSKFWKGKEDYVIREIGKNTYEITVWGRGDTPDAIYTVKMNPKGTDGFCDCPARARCKHIKMVKDWIKAGKPSEFGKDPRGYVLKWLEKKRN